jgi:hypothetical protein
MPLVDLKEDAVIKADPAPINVQITKPEYRGVTVDTRYVPTASIVAHIEGYSWTVDYYSQIINLDNAPSGQQVSVSAVHQQYKLIKGMEFKVSTPLTPSQDSETKSMNYTGEANIYPFLIPNQGDMFIADIGDGRSGLFQITESERLSIFRETAHHITYRLVSYISSSTDERLMDLTRKTQVRLQYVKDFLMHGQNPLVFEEDFVLIEQLGIVYPSVLERYFQSFFSKEYGTLLVPQQQKPVYDHFVVQAIQALVSTYDTPEVRYVTLLNADDDQSMKSVNIWNVLLKRDKRQLRECFKMAGWMPASQFTRDALLASVYHSGIDYVVYPKDPNLNVGYEYTDNLKVIAVETFIQGTMRDLPLQELIPDTDLEGLPYAGSPMLPSSVMKDDYYVLTKAFYTNSQAAGEQSKLELMVQDYLSGSAPKVSLILKMCDQMHAWTALERFYYTPVLIVLMKAALRSF